MPSEHDFLDEFLKEEVKVAKVKVKEEAVVHELLPAGFAGKGARVERDKVIGVHVATDGKTLCGTDVTAISPNLAAHKGCWQATKADADCARCLKATGKAAAPKAKVAKAPAAKKAVAKKGAAAKASTKSAASRSRSGSRKAGARKGK